MISIYVLEGCPYCKSAMSLLDQYNISYKKYVVDSEEKKQICKKQSGMSTFPQIYINASTKQSILVGGCDNLNEVIKYTKVIKSNNISIEALQYFYKKLYSK